MWRAVTATLAIRVRRSVAPAVVVCVRGTVASTVAAGVRVGWTVALALTPPLSAADLRAGVLAVCEDAPERARQPPAGTTQHLLRPDARVFRVKVYASNGLMRAGAWETCWQEMERVDVELEPLVGGAQKELESLAALRDALEAPRGLVGR